jgi:hypothetical protein
MVGVFFVLVVLAMFNSARSTSLGLSSGDMIQVPMYNGVPMGTPPMPSVSRESSFYDDGYVAGNDAEAFETKDYTVRYETSDFDNTCTALQDLKPKPNVIFLSATLGDTNCFFSFKVANAEVETILSILKDLDPKDLSEQTNSIKKQLENSLNQKDILTQNLAATEAILNDAIAAYDSLLTTATNAQDSTALAKAVRDKIELIDQLKQRRESTRQQIEWLNRSLAEQQDRLDYAYFSVSVMKRSYFDAKEFAASWQLAVKRMINEVNQVLQKASVGLVSFVLNVALYALYLIIIMLIAKIGWRTIRRIWRA